MNLKKLFVLKLVFVLLFSVSAFAQFGDEQQMSFSVIQNSKEVNVGSELDVAFKLNIFDTWHINSNNPKDEFLFPTTISLKTETFKFSNLIFPHAEEIKFDFSENPVAVYEGTVYVYGKIKFDEKLELKEYKIPVEIEYQSCNNSQCMPPNTITAEVVVTAVKAGEAVTKINNEVFEKKDAASENKQADEKVSELEGDETAAELAESGLFLSLILVFFGGLALNLTPCVYPLIPITIGYFGGQSEGSTGKLVGLGIFYILGMALTYSVVGVITALSGAVFGALMQNPIVIGVICLIFITLAVSMFGAFELKMPDSWVMKAGGAKSGNFGAFFMGLTMGIVAAPCIGPFVLSLVTLVAANGDPVYGFVMFFTMAVGLGLPYLFLAIFSGKLNSLPQAGMWMIAIKKIFGFLLLGMAIYFAAPLLPKAVNEFALPIFGIISVIYLLVFDTMANDREGFRKFKTIFSLVIFALSVFMLTHSYVSSSGSVEKVKFEKFDQEKFDASMKKGEKILVDFYADWCIPCKEYDAITFKDPEVVALSKSFDNYKIDMTKSDDHKEALRKKFGAKGMPTLIIFDTTGKEVKRFTGYVGPDEFVKILKSVN
ncbi:MAG: protein-disulfide reductase DsbD family protein [Rhodothermaceae bacterium]